MTIRNLNRSWRDIIFAQYASDFEADVLYPISYLIDTPQWKQSISITSPKKIDSKTFRQAIFTFFRALHINPDPTYEDDYISVRPHRSKPWAAKMISKNFPKTATPLELLARAAEGSNYQTSIDPECDSAVPGPHRATLVPNFPLCPLITAP